MKWLKGKLGCRFGFHRWGRWEWVAARGDDGHMWEGAVQVRPCLDCPKKQGPIISSEERRYWDSWRNR